MSEKSRIGDHAKVRRGASPRPIGDPKYFGGTVGWVRISDATSARKYLRKTEQYVSPLGESLSVRVDRGDLIMSICATIGRPVIVDMPACIHDGFVQFYEVNNDDKEYMYYLLQFHEKDLERKGQPGTQVNLNTTIVEDFEAFFPTSLAEQRKIARILSTVDAVIEKTEAAIAKYKAIKTGMMHDLFTRGIDLKTGKLRPRYEDAPELYKESELGWVPREWEVVRLDTVCDVTSSKRIYYHEYVEAGVPFYRSLEIILKSKHIEIENTLFISTERYKSIEKQFGVPNAGDILITSVGTLGITYRVKMDDRFYFKDGNLIWFRKFAESDYSEFLQYTLEILIRRQFDRITIGTSQKAFTIDKLKKLFVLQPKPQEAKAINEIFRNVNNNLLSEQSLLSKYQQLKTGLMSDLLTGKVRVKFNENEKVKAI